jgi:hypothetical protein
VSFLGAGDEQVTQVGGPVVSLEEASTRICALEQDMLTMRYNQHKYGGKSYPTPCCGKTMPSGVDEQRLQDREAMLA